MRAAGRPYPFEHPEGGVVSAELVEVAASAPRSEYIPIVLEVFEKLSDDAKWGAQALLSELESREAAEAFLEIVRRCAKTGRLPRLAGAGLEQKPRHADVFFPEILNYASDPKLCSGIYRLCIVYCEAKLLPPTILAPFTNQLLRSYGALESKLRAAQNDDGVGWMWEDGYQENRFEAALLLDLMTYFPSKRVEGELREALKYKDPRLKYFAIVSLLRRGRSVEKEAVEDVARHAEMRNWLFNRLQELGKSSLFPERFRTQAALAEGDMVNWLIFPTELNRVPDEIELMKVVTIDTGIYDYFLFRFRTREPHWAAKDGWMAGVSGPFLRKEQPTTKSLGETFSSFTKWETKSPEEHVGDTRELMKQWREYHLKSRN